MIFLCVFVAWFALSMTESTASRIQKYESTSDKSTNDQEAVKTLQRSNFAYCTMGSSSSTIRLESKNLYTSAQRTNAEETDKITII